MWLEMMALQVLEQPGGHISQNFESQVVTVSQERGIGAMF